jgi:hypothetical protein
MKLEREIKDDRRYNRREDYVRNNKGSDVDEWDYVAGDDSPLQP